MVLGRTSHVAPDEQQTPANRAAQANSPEKENSGFMGKLRNKLKDTHLYDAKVGAIHLKHRIGKFQNLVNSNHRHDEEHEKKTDAKRTAIAEDHRFQSFAPERGGNNVKWYIDGRDYFHAVSVALERAKESIYLEDWWISPELFLRRPPYFSQEWRLDKILKRAAERGVKIYIIVYKEVAAALTCNSAHTKNAFHGLIKEGEPGYGNIRVMRHPDHNVFENAGDMTFYWAHHEKFIVIDYNMAFIGGLDLCFGRWDSRQHPLSDAHPAGVQNEVFPGQDFNNNRIMDFQSVDDWKTNELSKAEYGRMPWHDVAMGVIGPCIYDIAEHFVLRWNFCKRDKYKRDDRYDWLTMSGRTGEDEDLVGVQRPKHPVGDYVHHPFSPIHTKAANPFEGRVDASGGATPEDYYDATPGVDEHGYTDDQHTKTRYKKKLGEHGFHFPGTHKDDDASELEQQQVNKQENAHHTGNKASKEGVITASGGKAAKTDQYTSQIVDAEGSTMPGKGYGSTHAQLVRSSADWSSGILTEQSIQNAYCQVIRGAQHFVYIENQFFITATGEKQAPVHNQIGAAIADACIRAGKEGRKFRVIIVIPAIPGFAGDLRDNAAAGTRAIMDYQYKSINRGEESIFGKIRAAGIDPNEHIFVFNLRSYDRVNKTPALKKQEEESGVSYQEVQRAQAEEIMSSGVHGVEGEGGSSSSDGEGDDDKETRQEKKRMKQRKRQFEEKRKTKGSDLGDARSDAKDPGSTTGGTDEKHGSVDSIAKDAMLGEPKPSEERWAGRDGQDNDGDVQAEEDREQEKENFIQEELYIHGKVCPISITVSTTMY
jgi:phospholipase D1/2